jgi:hypothetical protein
MDLSLSDRPLCFGFAAGDFSAAFGEPADWLLPSKLRWRTLPAG